MSSPPESLVLTWSRSMAEIDRNQWNALAQDASPFLGWDWLNLLETSGCVRPETGWMPVHCAVRLGSRLLAAAPLYVKGHGMGEYIPDQPWAEAARRLGVAYYPKLVAASPFTPVAGYRLLTDSAANREALCRVMLQAVDRLCRANALSGSHALFVEDACRADFEDNGYLAWQHQGFIWENAGYGSFREFLDRFPARRRKAVLRERRAVAEAGVHVEMISGPDIAPDRMARMYDFYCATNAKFGPYGCRYLTRDFFLGLPAVLGGGLVLAEALARGADEPVALALLVRKGADLYGRYWGCSREIPFLHFELCYYAPIEWAIGQGVRRFDPGMGGEHKPRRGFVSRPTLSLHRHHDPGLAALFAHHIGEINDWEMEYIRELNAMVCLKPAGERP